MPILVNSNLAGGWAKIAGVIPSQLTTLLNVVAVALLVFAFAKWLYDKKRGGGGGAGGNNLGWVIAFAALLALPTIIMPIVLRLLDLIINAAVKLAQGI